MDYLVSCCTYERAIDAVRAMVALLEAGDDESRADAMAILIDRRLATAGEAPAEIAARIDRMSDQELITALTPDVGRSN